MQIVLKMNSISSCSRSPRGQIKIQQMAFVLVAMMIFFGFVALIYFSLRISNLEESAVGLKDEEAKELIKKIASSPEFNFGVEDCSNCIDLDKVLVLSERKPYEEFWNLDYLEIEKVYPVFEEECNKANYPSCKTIRIIGESSDYGSATGAFVSLCRWEDSNDGYFKCELGRIISSGKGIK